MQVRAFLNELASSVFQIFYSFVGVIFFSLYFFCVFHISCFHFLFFSVVWTFKILSDWTGIHHTYYSFIGVLKFFFIELVSFLKESSTSFWLVRFSWEQGWIDKATLDKQMYTNVSHVKISHIVLHLCSHRTKKSHHWAK